MESTLSLKKIDFEAKVGNFFGWGRGAQFDEDAWDDRKIAVIRDCVESGLRQFYFPVPQGGVPYDWSFLRPVLTITIDDASSTKTLPDDFGGMDGKISISSPTSRWRFLVEFVNEGVIRELYVKNPERTGVPMWASTRPLKTTGVIEGQRSELFWYPTTDEEFTFQFKYYLLANSLDGTHPYAYGGMAHAETILESCLSIAESRYDDQMDGPRSKKYQERLAASIAHDRRNKPEAGMRNTDRSDQEDRYSWRDREAVSTYNGIVW